MGSGLPLRNLSSVGDDAPLGYGLRVPRPCRGKAADPWQEAHQVREDPNVCVLVVDNRRLVF